MKVCGQWLIRVTLRVVFPLSVQIVLRLLGPFLCILGLNVVKSNDRDLDCSA